MKNICFTLLASLFFGSSFGQTDIWTRPLHGCNAELEEGQRSTTYCSTCNFWPDGNIQYSFDDNVTLEMESQAIQAMNTLESIAGLNFVPHTNGPRIKFKNSDGNNSPVGMLGGTNTINLFNWNNQQIIIHEIFHSLGIWHEQSRPDRNNYVQIIENNICSGYGNNFDVELSGVTTNIPYDFESIMHYRTFAFSKCADNSDCSDGCGFGFGNYIGPTIQLLSGYSQFESVLGQRDYLSRGDSLLISFVYPFSNYRFINNQINSSGNAQYLYTASDDLTEDILESALFDPGDIIWIMPGTFNNAEGIYEKSCHLKAPFGGVILE